MNQYFNNLATNLINKENLDSSYETLTNNLPTENCCHSFRIRHTNYTDECEIITNLKNDCSSGHDIPVRYIKPVAELNKSPLAHTINTSIDRVISPKQWKISRVSPIPKTDQSNNVKDCTFQDL